MTVSLTVWALRTEDTQDTVWYQTKFHFGSVLKFQTTN